MSSAARRLVPNAVAMEAGVVVRAHGDAVVVKTHAGELEARRAAHCLVAPEANDTVVVASLADGRSYVTGVLERAAATPPVIDSPQGDLALRLTGRLAISAAEGIDLVTKRALGVVAAALEAHASDARAVVERFTLLAGSIDAELERVKVAAVAIDSVVDRVTQRAKRVYRFVEELDQLKAARVDYEARSTLSLHAENALVTADNLVKVDAEQIHVG